MSANNGGCSGQVWRVKVRNVSGGETLYIHTFALSPAFAITSAISVAQTRWRNHGIRTSGTTAAIVDEMGRPREDVEREMERDAFVAEEGTRS